MSRQRQPGVEPFAQIYTRFIGVTTEIPQHPVGGVAVVGTTVLRMIEQGELSAEAFIDTPMDRAAQNNIAAATANIHRLVGVKRSAADLKTSIPFAYDLVRNGIVSTAAEYLHYQEGVIQPTIDVINDDDRAAFLEVAGSAHHLDYYGHMLRCATRFLLDPSSEAQPLLNTYRNQIVAIGATPVSIENTDQRMRDMGHARDTLTEALHPHLSETIPSVEPNVRDIIAGNLLRNTPSRALLEIHFGPLPA